MVFDIYSPAWAIGLLILAWGMAHTRFFVWADDSNNVLDRVDTIDGLRGFLALAVLAHHGAIYWGFAKTGFWEQPPSNLYSSLGPIGVGLFFMISAFLFWGRVLRSERMDWLGLYVGRVFRIAPLYLAVTIIVLSVTIANVGWLPVNAVVRWLALGSLVTPDVAGYPSNHLVAGVMWTLRYEWIFYAALLPLSLVRRWHIAVAVLGLVAALTRLELSGAEGVSRSAIVALFFSGMLCASIKHTGFRLRLPDSIKSMILVVLLLTSASAFSVNYKTLPIVILLASFFLISQHTTTFGVLTGRAAMRLGNISFGIYLTHGLCLFAILNFWPAEIAKSPAVHWIAVCASMLVCLAVSLLAHRFLERPGMAIGRIVIRRLLSPRRIGAESSAPV